MDKLDNKERTFPYSRYLIIFALSIVIGYYAKTMAASHISMGFEDWKITTASSEYSLEEIEKKVEKLREEQAAEIEKRATESGTVNGGGATGESGQCTE